MKFTYEIHILYILRFKIIFSHEFTLQDYYEDKKRTNNFYISSFKFNNFFYNANHVAAIRLRNYKIILFGKKIFRFFKEYYYFIKIKEKKVNFFVKFL